MVRLELGKTGIEVILERLAQERLIRVGVIGAKHAVGEPVEADWIVVGPGYGEAESLGELLQVD